LGSIRESNQGSEQAQVLGSVHLSTIFGGAVAKEIAEWTDLAEAINDKVKGKKIVVTATICNFFTMSTLCMINKPSAPRKLFSKRPSL